MIELNNRKGLATICLISTSGGEVGALFRGAGISCIVRVSNPLYEVTWRI